MSISLLLAQVSTALLLALHGGESDFKHRPKPGDGGKALGALQIHDIAIRDVNRVYGSSYSHADALDRDKAYTICKLYLTHWGKYYTRKTGKPPTPEVYARIWNGGPTGWKKPSTVKYWRKRVKPYFDNNGR